jgi:predicted DCC family thiol-disulfide oxidoreductase YuxK
MNTLVQDEKKSIVFFDSDCVLCTGTVQFIVKYERKKTLYFAPLQSNIFKELNKSKIVFPDSVILYLDHNFYIYSDAIAHICFCMGGYWKIIGFIIHLIPKFISDFIYRVIAANRKTWFGTHQACMMPMPELRKRMLT